MSWTDHRERRTLGGGTGATVERADAKLTLEVIPPAVCRIVGGDGAGMNGAGGDGAELEATGYRVRGPVLFLRGVSVANLEIAVAAPAIGTIDRCNTTGGNATGVQSTELEPTQDRDW